MNSITNSKYPIWLSDAAAFYLRKLPHRGQLRLFGAFEKLTGGKRWNVKTAFGFRLALDRSDWVQWTILKTGEWDPEVAKALSNRMSKDDVFFDIGANIGYFSLLALSERGGTVVAFEPFPSLANQIMSNLASNGFSPSELTVHRGALGKEQGVLNYLPGPPENSGAGSLVSHSSELTTEVTVSSLDDLIYDEKPALPNPTVMKIDVEGHELNVLEGARRLFASAPPHTVIFEADCNSSFEIQETAIVDFFESNSYQIEHLPREVSEPKENYMATFTST